MKALRPQLGKINVCLATVSLYTVVDRVVHWREENKEKDLKLTNNIISPNKA